MEIKTFTVKTKKSTTLVDINPVKDYIDLNDQLAGYCNKLSKGLKWFRKFAFDLWTDTAVVNIHTVSIGGKKKNLNWLLF